MTMAGTDTIRNSGTATARIIGAIIFTIAGVSVAFGLKVYDHVGENNLCLLIVFFSGTGVLISFIDRFKDFTIGLTGIKGTLAQIEKTEASVKEVAGAMLEVIEAKSHALMLETYDEEKAQEAIDKLKQLIA